MKKIFLFLMLFFVLIFSSTKEAYASVVSEEFTNYYFYRRGGGEKDHSGELYNYEIDGVTTYCIEPGVKIKEGADYVEQSSSPLSATLTKKIGLIGYYGYDYPGHQTLNYRMATQLLIWEAVGGQKNEVWTEAQGSGDTVDISAEREEINNLVSNHTKTPSFDYESKTTTVGKEVIFEDTSNILSEYEIQDVDGCKVSFNGNELHVTPLKGGNHTVTLKRKMYTTKPTKFFFATGSQNQAYFGATYPVYSVVHINGINAMIEINKVGDDKVKLSNVTFEVYDENEEKVCEIKTDKNGYGKCENLALGKYKVKEIESATGYIKDDKVYEVELTNDKTQVTLNIENKKIKGYIELYKKDEDLNKSIAQGSASLSGAIYGIYNEDKELVSKLVTNEEGYAKSILLPYGIYYVKEISPSIGYLKDDKEYTVFIQNNNEVITVNSKEPIIKGYIEIYKVDADTNKGIPEGDSSLQGAIYGIYNSKGEKVEEITTNSKGYAKSSALIYDVYTIKEEKASQGYKLDKEIYHINVNNNLETVTITSKEPIKKYRFKLIKTMTDGKSGISKIEKDAKFNIYLKRTNELIGSITTDELGEAAITLPYGTYTVCQTSGNKYTIYAPCFDITVKTKGVEKVVNNEPIKALIKVVKMDIDTNNIIPLAGIKFKIKDIDSNKYICQNTTYPTPKTICEFATDKNGIIYTPQALTGGNYELEEVDEPIQGYLWNKEKIKFSIDRYANLQSTSDGLVLEINFYNKEVKGEVNVYKEGEKLEIKDNKYFYEDIPLDKITYELYANEDIYQGDGTLLYKKDELINTYETKDGKIKITNLNLGSYYLIETKTLDGYVLDSEKHYFNLTYKDQYTDIVSVDVNLKNYLEKGKLVLNKKDLENNPLPGAKIAIYYYTDDENMAELIYEDYTDELGQLKLKDLPIGKYYLIETEAPEGYLLNNTKLYFEIKKNNDEVILELINEPSLNQDYTFTVPNTYSHSINWNIILTLVLLITCGLYEKKKYN